MSNFISLINDPEVKEALDAIDLSTATIEVIDTDREVEAYHLNDTERFYLPGHRGDNNPYKGTFNR